MIVYILIKDDRVAFHGFTITEEKNKGQTLPGHLITDNGYIKRKDVKKEDIRYPDIYLDGLVKFSNKSKIKDTLLKIIHSKVKYDKEIKFLDVNSLNDVNLIAVLEQYFVLDKDNIAVSTPVKYWDDNKPISDIVDDNRKVFILGEYDPKEYVLINYKEDLDVSKKNSKGQVKHHYNEVGKAEPDRRFTLWFPKNEELLITELYSLIKPYLSNITDPIIIDLAPLFIKLNWRLYKLFGKDVFSYRYYREGHQITLNNSPVIYQPRPVVSTKIMIEYVREFKDIERDNTIVNITDILYEKNAKGDLVFRKSIKSYFDYPVEALYRNKKKVGVGRAVFGDDILSEMICKRIAKTIDRVEVIFSKKDKGLMIFYYFKFTFKDGSYAYSSSLFTNKIYVPALING